MGHFFYCCMGHLHKLKGIVLRMNELLQIFMGKVMTFALLFQIDQAELEAIASKPLDIYMFTVGNFDALDSIKEQLAISACEGILLITDISKEHQSIFFNLSGIIRYK